MPIQRQYSLPNCTLVLEGLSAKSEVNPAIRPSLDVLIRFECRLLGLPAPLIGGRNLLTGLLYAVSQALQESLSSVQRLQSLRLHPDSQGIQIQLLPADRFRLHIPETLLLQPFSTPTPSNPEANGKTGSAIEFELSLVQMFDLLEALDQLCADSQTLPDVSPQLRSLPRRSASLGNPLAKQAKPVTLGVGSLAVAATVFFFMPVPQVRPPEPTSATSQQTSPKPEQSPAASTPPSPPPQTPPSPTASPQAQVEPQPSPTVTPSTPPSPITAAPAPAPVRSLATVSFGGGLAVREAPSSDSARLGGVDFAEEVEILAASPDREWQRIRSRVSGVEGWVKAGNLEPVQQQP